MKLTLFSGESNRYRKRITLRIFYVAVIFFIPLLLFGFIQKKLLADNLFVRAMNAPAHWFSSFKSSLTASFKNYLMLVDVKKNNQNLLEERDVLMAQNRLLIGKIDLLEDVVKGTARLNLTHNLLLAANVIGYDVMGAVKTALLDVGLEHGVSEEQMVVSGDGLVGRVTRAYPRSSEVLLLCDPHFAVDVVNERTGSRMMVTGLTENRLKGNRYPFLSHAEFVERGSEIRVGDELMTSGMGGLYPARIPVGKVVEVKSGVDQMVDRLLVQPVVDFAKVRRFFVVLPLEAGVATSQVVP